MTDKTHTDDREHLDGRFCAAKMAPTAVEQETPRNGSIKWVGGMWANMANKDLYYHLMVKKPNDTLGRIHIVLPNLLKVVTVRSH